MAGLELVFVHMANAERAVDNINEFQAAITTIISTSLSIGAVITETISNISRMRALKVNSKKPVIGGEVRVSCDINVCIAYAKLAKFLAVGVRQAAIT